MLSLAKFGLEFKWLASDLPDNGDFRGLLARRWSLMIPRGGCRYKPKSDGRHRVRFAHWSGRPTMEGVES